MQTPRTRLRHPRGSDERSRRPSARCWPAPRSTRSVRASRTSPRPPTRCGGRQSCGGWRIAPPWTAGHVLPPRGTAWDVRTSPPTAGGAALRSLFAAAAAPWRSGWQAGPARTPGSTCHSPKRPPRRSTAPGPPDGIWTTPHRGSILRRNPGRVDGPAAPARARARTAPRPRRRAAPPARRGRTAQPPRHRPPGGVLAHQRVPPLHAPTAARVVARRDGRAGGRGRSGGLPGPLARRDGGRRPAPAPSGADHRRPPRRAPRRTPPPRGRRRAAGRHRRARHRQDDAAGRSVAAGVDLRGPGRRAADPRRRALRARVGRAAPGLARRRGPVVRGGAGPLPRVRGTGAVPDPAGDRTGGSRRRGSLRGRPPVRGHRVHPCRAVVAPSAGARARGPALLRPQLARLHRAARRRWPGRPDRRQPAQRRVHAQGRGVPLFTEELARSMTAGTEPEPLADLLARQLDHLSPSARSVLLVAALADRPLPPQVVADATSMGRAELTDARRELVARHLLADPYAATDVTVGHPLTSAAVRAGAVPGEAVPTHRRLAAVLAAMAHPTPAEVAEHWRGAGDAREELPWRVAAGRAACDGLSRDEEAVHWERALALWPADGPPPVDAGITRCELLLELVHATSGSGRREQARSWVDEALALTPASPAHDHARALRRAGQALAQVDPETSVRLADE